MTDTEKMTIIVENFMADKSSNKNIFEIRKFSTSYRASKSLSRTSKEKLSRISGRINGYVGWYVKVFFEEFEDVSHTGPESALCLYIQIGASYYRYTFHADLIKFVEDFMMWSLFCWMAQITAYIWFEVE